MTLVADLCEDTVDSMRSTSVVESPIHLIQLRARLAAAEISEQRQLSLIADILSKVIQVGVIAYCGNQSSAWSLTQTEVRIADELILSKVEAVASRLQDQPSIAARIVDLGKITWKALALRIRSHSNASQGIIVTFRSPTHSDEYIQSLLEVVANEIAFARSDRDRQKMATELECSSAVLELTSDLESCNSISEACQLFAELVAKHLKVVVAIGLFKTPKSPCQLKSISGVSGVDPLSPRAVAFSAALDELAVHDASTYWPPLDPKARRSLLTHQRLVDRQFCSSVIGMPIRNSKGELIGGWLCMADDELHQKPYAIGFLRVCSYRLGPTLELLQRAERSRTQRIWNHIRSKLSLTMRRALVLMVMGLIALMAAPWPHYLKCDCELQPVTRRYVAAPFEGTLEKSFVEPGDIVNAGDLLARIDDREIHWELAGIDAEQQKALKERDTKLAKNDIAAAQLAWYDADRLELRRRLLNHRKEHLEVRSPISGLVISGDLKHSEGVPLTTGKTLFEIAPLEEMIVEVAIPERDISFAFIDQPLELTIEGFFGTRWNGKLLRIHPRSEMRDNKSVFIGEFQLTNDDRRLLPGMHGHAKLESEWKPIGWLLFHRAWETLVEWLGA